MEVSFGLGVTPKTETRQFATLSSERSCEWRKSESISTRRRSADGRRADAELRQRVGPSTGTGSGSNGAVSLAKPDTRRGRVSSHFPSARASPRDSRSEARVGGESAGGGFFQRCL